MALPDYEAEYNNRARVPEHPALIEGWARDAAAYRSGAGSRHRSVRYGEGERQVIDIFEPVVQKPGATLMFIHGGYWQALERSYFSHLARGANAHGLTVAIPGYDLCPKVRVADIVGEMRQACRLLASHVPLVVSGHSAGGHLAACLLATDWRKEGLPAGLVRAAYAISGLFDLEPLVQTSLNKALNLSMEEAHALSPLHWSPPAGARLDAVVGAQESSEYLRQSRAIVDRWGRAGVDTIYGEVAGTNHFTVIAPLFDPGSAMTRRLVALACPA
jgi:arylformamidase